MRLDQFVSQALTLSRKQAQQLIRAQCIRVNGQIVTQASTLVPNQAQVYCEDESICLPGALYLMLHKPLGVISATEDPSQRTVLDLIQHPHFQRLRRISQMGACPA